MILYMEVFNDINRNTKQEETFRVCGDPKGLRECFLTLFRSEMMAVFG